MKSKILLITIILGLLISNNALAQLPSLLQYTKPTQKRISLIQTKSPSDTDAAMSLLQKSIQKIKADSIKAFADSISSTTERQKKFKFLKNDIKNVSVTDTDKINRLYAKINSIKIYNTNEFLTTLKPSRPFTIAKLGSYNIDSLNKYFYNQGNISVFQNAGIQNFTGSTTYITAELASFLFGPVRMGVAGTFLSKGDTTKDNAIKSSIQKIVSNGGSVNFDFSLPLLFCRSRTEQMHFGIFAQMNFGINPGIDSTGTTSFSKNVSFINQSGILFHFDVGSNDQQALLSFDLPCYYVSGSNNAMAQLGLPKFSVIKLQVGVTINNLLNLHISGPVWSSSKTVLNTPFIASLQFSPAQVLKSSK